MHFTINRSSFSFDITLKPTSSTSDQLTRTISLGDKLTDANDTHLETEFLSTLRSNQNFILKRNKSLDILEGHNHINNNKRHLDPIEGSRSNHNLR